ncbi:MAG TPA: DUF2244 domain-containing protein [Caulobacteraceae bacterium]|nr:DUF2244 domain-containing protein [Caulobacteraceae bacterium]
MDGPLYMDAVITPHRSLSERGFIVLIGFMTAVNCVTALIFVMMGSGLVLPFMSLDLVAVVVAFALSNRAARKTERVQVSAAQVRVLLETPKGTETVWTSPTAWTRVTLIGEAEDATDLRLNLSGREHPVATALSRRERLDFAQALDEAIMRARKERHAV